MRRIPRSQCTWRAKPLAIDASASACWKIARAVWRIWPESGMRKIIKIATADGVRMVFSVLSGSTSRPLRQKLLTAEYAEETQRTPRKPAMKAFRKSCALSPTLRSLPAVRAGVLQKNDRLLRSELTSLAPELRQRDLRVW